MLKFYTPETLDFAKFKMDLERWKVITGGTYSEIAASLYRAPGYISNIFNVKKIRADVLDGICDCCGLNPDDYVIKKPNKPAQAGWYTAINIDGTKLVVNLWHDGILC